MLPALLLLLTLLLQSPLGTSPGSSPWALPYADDSPSISPAGIPVPDKNGCYLFLPDRPGRRDVAWFRTHYVLNKDDMPRRVLPRTFLPLLTSEVTPEMKASLLKQPNGEPLALGEVESLTGQSAQTASDTRHVLDRGVRFVRSVDEEANEDTVFTSYYDYDEAGKLIQVRRMQRRVVRFIPEKWEREELNRTLVYTPSTKSDAFVLQLVVISPDTGGSYFYTPTGNFIRFEDESGCFVLKPKNRYRP